ncbi:MAG TPA: lanthionine synthetase LanC family protein [Candidatus Saccharimonadales bacterium]|jgi:hypothetical protein
MSSDYLQEAIRIGEQLLADCEHDDHGASWTTPALNLDSSISWGKEEDLYGGVSGIVLFLIELYRQTGDKKYLKVAKEAMHWVDWYCERHPTNNYAFISGRMGVSFAYLKLHETTNEKKYLTKALRMAKGSPTFLEAPHVNDFINGFAGTTLALIHLHAATREQWVLDDIQKYVNELLQNARFDGWGLYWDSSHYEIRPLCGFSHGPSGIGFVFLELGHYFKNPTFYYVAELAFKYEDQYFDRRMGNWPDFRLDLHTSDKVREYEAAYKKGNVDALERPLYTNVWCHGAAGIGMARLRALSLIKNASYDATVKRVLKKTQHSSDRSYTLCHGKGGNVDLFIEDYLQRKNDTALGAANAAATQAIDQQKQAGKYASGLPHAITAGPEDPSLFNGIAGVGYFMLRVANPEAVPSLLVPKLNVTAELTPKHLKSSLAHIQKSLIANMLPRTLQILEQFAAMAAWKYFQDNRDVANIIESFIAFSNEFAALLPADQKRHLSDTLRLEVARIKLQRTLKSNGALYIKDKINREAAGKLLAGSDDALLGHKFHVSPVVELITQVRAVFLLKLASDGVEETQINSFCSHVLRQFTQPKSVAAAVNTIDAYYKPQTPEERQQLRQKTIAQIRGLLSYGALQTT